ncbi:hypothetical protein BHE74_00012765 [Ensete ventricosum]|uniref:Uncharacterized protein n=1 Tax=Ensete ventricosum TaxID=4639 RepID=A0A426Z2D7_ENSVE|nr:hypothetical protein B296_00012084 [Ensete ventricosum]RWW25634.1 hypothetical protein GW17_00010007 [Ensete ventricosum]RWW78969.1 hypothetical protein BHE74_00012765 [Ensete ventricosum]RZR92194.1 hypothetical protein BHM03_00020479 [Ensete ventricosum]
MADLAPVLPHYNSSGTRIGAAKKPPPTSVDDTLERYTDGNRASQLLQATFVSSLSFSMHSRPSSTSARMQSPHGTAPAPATQRRSTSTVQ